MAVAAVPVPPRAAKRRAAKPSDFDTQSMPAIPRDPDAELGLARTMVPTARTMIATTTRTIATPSVPRADESSLDIPFEAEFVDGEPVRPRGRRPITLGDGMLQRVPQRRAWLLQTVVVLVTASIGLVAIAI